MRVVLMLSLLSVPSLVHANQLRVTSYDMDEAGGTVHLASDAAIGDTWMRVDGRSVRIWFPRIVDIARFDHVRESGDAIRGVMLRPGASDTAVLKVELGVAKHIDPSDVEIARSGNEVSVRIRVPGMVPAAETTTSAMTAAPTAARAPAPQPVIQVTAPEAPATPPSKAPSLGTVADSSTAKSTPLAAEPEFIKEQKPTLSYLLLACVVLGAVLAALQLVNKRKPRQRPEIEVLGARRLGHRQELLIVRALGSDHLLLCTAGRAERVASTPTPATLPADTIKETESSQAGGIGLISRLSSHHRLRKLLDNVEREAADDVAHEQDELPEQTFGAELFTAARKQRPLQSLPASRGRQSESVAGISRLRKRAAS